MRVQRKEAIKLKEEYHAFRDRAGVILFVFAAVLLVGLLRADAVRTHAAPHGEEEGTDAERAPCMR